MQIRAQIDTNLHSVKIKHNINDMKRQQSQWRWGIHHIDLRCRCNNKSIRIQTSEDYWWFIPSSSTCMHIPVCRLGRLAAAVAAWLCMSWFPYSKHCYKGIHPLSLGFTIMLREAGHDLLLVELWQLMMTVHFLFFPVGFSPLKYTGVSMSMHSIMGWFVGVVHTCWETSRAKWM